MLLHLLYGVRKWREHVQSGRRDITNRIFFFFLLCKAYSSPLYSYRLVGVVVEASASGAEGPEFESCLRWDFFGLSHISDLKIGTPVATLPAGWRYRVSAGTGGPGVSIL